LSLFPAATLERAFWYTALLLAFLVVHRRTVDERRAGLYRATLFVSFGLLAAVGILNRVTAPDRLLWLRDVPPLSRPFGPYVNPSHFAGVMELAVPWMLGYGLVLTSHRAGTEARRLGRVLALAGAALGAVAAFLAASKMGALTIGLGSAALIALALATGRRHTRTIVGGSVLVAAALSAAALIGPLRERVADFTAVHSGAMSQNVRGLAWSAGSLMGADFRLMGSGFGAFGEVFPAYLPRGEADNWLQLHNDYFELYLAGGLIASVLAAWLAVAFAARVARVVRVAVESGRLLPVLGLVFGLIALASHEFVDFNLQIPANALLFVVIAAMAVSPLSRSVEEP